MSRHTLFLSVVRLASATSLLTCYSLCVDAAEYSLRSYLNSSVEIDDNIFLASGSPDTTSVIKVTPEVRLKFGDAAWSVDLTGKGGVNKYSESRLDDNDIFVTMASRLIEERNQYNLGLDFRRDNNLNPSLSDFALVQQPVNSNRITLSPQYQRTLTRRLSLSLMYSYTDMEYDNAAGTSYVSYSTDQYTAGLNYSMSQRTSLRMSLSETDYVSDDDSFAFDLFVTNVGVNHALTETTTLDFSAGISDRSTSNRSTQLVNFFGQPISVVAHSNQRSNSVLLNLMLSKNYETGSRVELVFNQNEVANSLGGLNDESNVSLNWKLKQSELLDYTFSTELRDIESVLSGVSVSDRRILSLEAKMLYKIAREWQITAGLRHMRREFTDITAIREPESNRITVGLRYVFPEISTY